MDIFLFTSHKDAVGAILIKEDVFSIFDFDFAVDAGDFGVDDFDIAVASSSDEEDVFIFQGIDDILVDAFQDFEGGAVVFGGVVLEGSKAFDIFLNNL